MTVNCTAVIVQGRDCRSQWNCFVKVSMTECCVLTIWLAATWVLMWWCPMWWWNPPRKFQEISWNLKKCNHLHISSHEHPFFSTVFSAVFIALRDLSLLMRFSALRIEDMQCEICFILGYEHGFTCFLYSCLRESKSLQHLCLHLPEPTMALNYEQLISKWGIQCHRWPILQRFATWFCHCNSQGRAHALFMVIIPSFWHIFSYNNPYMP
jgi:hypothetical protein